MAVDIVAGGGGEKHSRAGEVFRVSPASGRNPIENLARAFGIVLQSLSVVGGEVSGRDGVYVDALRSPLIGEGLGELPNASFGSCVRRHHDSALKRKQRGNVDDLAVALGQHVTACM